MLQRIGPNLVRQSWRSTSSPDISKRRKNWFGRAFATDVVVWILGGECLGELPKCMKLLPGVQGAERFRRVLSARALVHSCHVAFWGLLAHLKGIFLIFISTSQSSHLPLLQRKGIWLVSEQKGIPQRAHPFQDASHVQAVQLLGGSSSPPGPGCGRDSGVLNHKHFSVCIVCVCIGFFGRFLSDLLTSVFEVWKVDR